MPFPTIGNLGPALADLKKIADECTIQRMNARRLLDDIRPALIGQRVARYGKTFQIVQVDIGNSGAVNCYGATVSKRGKVGTRGFDLGRLEDCEFLP